MICSFEMQIYPRKSPPGYNGYMVASYKVHEKLVDKYGKTLKRIKVVGHLLPTARSVRYNITGHWQTGKHGLEYQMEDYEEIVENSRDGIIAYLSSGLIKGIGPKLAERIYDRFGEDTLEVMETNMEELLAIPGISKKKLERIQVSYLINRGARHVVALLAPHGMEKDFYQRNNDSLTEDDMSMSDEEILEQLLLITRKNPLLHQKVQSALLAP